jgi:hypothetical protein
MTHIYYTLTGLFLLTLAIFITSAFSVTEVITGMINEFNNRPTYATILTVAILGVSYLIGGVLHYQLFNKED